MIETKWIYVYRIRKEYDIDGSKFRKKKLDSYFHVKTLSRHTFLIAPTCNVEDYFSPLESCI